MPVVRGSLRVLVVDDERLIADSLAQILRARGFDCRALYSAEEVVELAPTWKPDLVITDVIMGPLNGVALAIYLGQVLPSCKVVLMSGNLATPQLISEAGQQAREFPILAKPFHPEEMFKIVDAGLAAESS